MKRTRDIRLNAFRKHETMLTLAVTTIFLLSGCEQNNDKVSIYKNAEDCRRAEPDKSQQCNVAWQQAQQQAIGSAPVYQSETACIATYGAGQCQPKPDPQSANSYSSHSFIPLIAGFAIGRMLSASQQAKPLFAPRSASGQGLGTICRCQWASVTASDFTTSNQMGSPICGQLQRLCPVATSNKARRIWS